MTPPAADDDRKSAIVTTASRKRLKLLRAEEPAKQDDPEATARVRAFFTRMVRPGGALPPHDT